MRNTERNTRFVEIILDFEKRSHIELDQSFADAVAFAITVIKAGGHNLDKDTGKYVMEFAGYVKDVAEVMSGYPVDVESAEKTDETEISELNVVTISSFMTAALPVWTHKNEIAFAEAFGLIDCVGTVMGAFIDETDVPSNELSAVMSFLSESFTDLLKQMEEAGSEEQEEEKEETEETETKEMLECLKDHPETVANTMALVTAMYKLMYAAKDDEEQLNHMSNLLAGSVHVMELIGLNGNRLMESILHNADTWTEICVEELEKCIKKDPIGKILWETLDTNNLQA